MATLTAEVDQVYEWSKNTLGETTAQKLKEHGVDGTRLLSLKYHDLLVVPTGPRRKLIHAIEEANASPSTPAYVPTRFQPFTKLKNVISPEDVPKIREFFAEHKSDTSVYGSDYSKLVLNERFYLPSLEDRLNELFPDMMVFQTNFFSGDAEKGEYSGWHTGVNLNKLFVNNPKTFTVWIPLQSLTEETGGRLWFYNGEYLDMIIDLINPPATDKKTMLYQYVMVNLLEETELDKHKVTEDCELGDAILFWEMNPHCVDKLCKIKRDVVSVRLITRDAIVDNDFVKELEDFPEDEKINFIDSKRALMSLHAFVDGTRRNYNTSLEIEKERRGSK